jgi:hypothetical protein
VSTRSEGQSDLRIPDEAVGTIGMPARIRFDICVLSGKASPELRRTLCDTERVSELRDAQLTLIRKGEILCKSLSRHPSWMSKRLMILCAFIIVWDAAAFGQNQNPSSDAPMDPSIAILSYGRNDVSCREWSDSCVTCKRHPTSEDYSCSNIGIACQPKNVECLRREDEPKPKTDK